MMLKSYRNASLKSKTVCLRFRVRAAGLLRMFRRGSGGQHQVYRQLSSDNAGTTPFEEAITSYEQASGNLYDILMTDMPKDYHNDGQSGSLPGPLQRSHLLARQCSTPGAKNTSPIARYYQR